MPRGVRKREDYESQLKTIDEELTQYQHFIKELTEKRSELLKKKEESDVKKLYQYMSANGLSVSQVLTVLAETEKKNTLV